MSERQNAGIIGYDIHPRFPTIAPSESPPVKLPVRTKTPTIGPEADRNVSATNANEASHPPRPGGVPTPRFSATMMGGVATRAV